MHPKAFVPDNKWKVVTPKRQATLMENNRPLIRAYEQEGGFWTFWDRVQTFPVQIATAEFSSEGPKIHWEGWAAKENFPEGLREKLTGEIFRLWKQMNSLTEG